MKNIKLIKLISTLSLLSLGGCATLFTGSSQNVNLQALSAEDNSIISGASCNIRDGNGNIYSTQGNPSTVNVKKGVGSLSPTCKKEGYKHSSNSVSSTVNPVTFVNILFWPGFLVDIATGSINKYPSTVSVLMEEK